MLILTRRNKMNYKDADTFDALGSFISYQPLTHAHIRRYVFTHVREKVRLG